MSSALLTERTHYGAGLPGSYPQAASPATMPPAANMCVVPRCTLKFEKCKGGCKIHCCCDDEISAATLQNLCRMLCDSTCSCCCTWNGIAICNVSLCCGSCKCEPTKDGVCITCTSGDQKCCEMLQSCCDALQRCCESGCCCYVCFGNTPCCCGTC